MGGLIYRATEIGSSTTRAKGRVYKSDLLMAGRAEGGCGDGGKVDSAHIAISGIKEREYTFYKGLHHPSRSLGA